MVIVVAGIAKLIPGYVACVLRNVFTGQSVEEIVAPVDDKHLILVSHIAFDETGKPERS